MVPIKKVDNKVMNWLLTLILLSLLFGCSYFKGKPEVAEVSDEVWQKFKKQTEERMKANKSKTKELQKQDIDNLNKKLEELGGSGKKK